MGTQTHTRIPSYSPPPTSVTGSMKTQKIKTTLQHPVLDANPPLSMSSEPSELSPGTPFPTIPPGIFNGPGLMGGLPPLATSDRAPDELSPRLSPDLGEVRRLDRYGA